MPPHNPVWNIDGVLNAQRELILIIKRDILLGSDLTFEQAELLLALYTARELRLWKGVPADSAGYVPCSELRQSLGDSPPLLSRLLTGLVEKRWVKIKHAEAGATDSEGRRLHGNSQMVRIESEGMERIKPVWDSLHKLADHLLADVTPEDRQAHRRVCEEIVNKLRSPWRPTITPPKANKP
jgi:DNA-binding MarR family transcriptional regulator